MYYISIPVFYARNKYGPKLTQIWTKMGTSAGRPRDPVEGRSRDNGQSISLNSTLKHIELTFKVCNNAKKNFY